MAIQCLQLLLREITEDFVDSLDEDSVHALLGWMNNGAQPTIAEFHALPQEERENIIEFIADFEAYAELTVNNQDYILVHAGFGDHFCYLTPLEEYSLDELVWFRTDYDLPYFDDKIVITGHTPTQYIACNPHPGYIYKGNNHIALDCGACAESGRLAGICLETGEEFYSRE